MQTKILKWGTTLMLAGLLGATPALAQGKSKHDKGNKHRAEQMQRDRRDGDGEWERNERDRRELERSRRDDDREWDRSNERRERGQKKVPPGWCIGRGNPHNTVENCGSGRDRYDPRYDDRRDDDRYDRRSGSYARAHESFHRAHDRECRERLARRPLDPIWQVRVRSECKAEHDRWHERAGINHDGTRHF